MLFPESERVIYDQNPLEEVICELRFPQILRIESEAPAAFQDRVRGEYPLVNKRTPLNLGLPPEVAKIFPLELNIKGDLWRTTSHLPIISGPLVSTAVR